ncbi:MAG: hypothetical protein IJZ83_07140 [Clostridia bacterium]|nr:hypothetical protein [Clostridia bacterium]
MYRLNYTKDEITNFLHQYRSFPEIRRIEWKDAIEKNNFPYAIQLLKESKKIDAQQPNWVNEYSRQLIELYEKQNDLASCRAELSEYIFTRSHYELNQIQKLKNASETPFYRRNTRRIFRISPFSNGPRYKSKRLRRDHSTAKKMETYPNGEIMSQTLADEWRENYKRRSALLDELNKAGFVEKSQRIC